MSATLPTTRPHPSGRRRKGLLLALRYLFVVLALLFFLFPIFWVITTAFKLPGEYLANPPVWLPTKWTLAHFRSVMPTKGWLALQNSLAVAGGATALSLAIGSLAAYSLTRFRTGGNHLAFWLLSQRLMPPVVLVIPLFLLLRLVGGIDTRIGLIMLYTVFNLPYVIWMMRSYFADVPVEVEESALVDGCSRLGVFRKISLPLAVPGLIATGSFAFIFSWTEFLFALIITRTRAVTLPVTIAGFYGAQGSVWGQAAALSTVAVVPLFVLGLVVQRHLVRGLTLGAVRG
jgi:multiple sugar transport system permease protein